jgi:predicted aspartyl protease
MPTVPFRLEQTAILVDGLVNGRQVSLTVDTGDAIGPTFNSADAKALGLPALGPLDVSGAGGSVEIQKTQADITLGGTTFGSEPGAIDPNLQGTSLLGLPFFLRQGGKLCFDFDSSQLSFGNSQPVESWWESFKRLLGL